jgi:hypothetical protein
MGAETRSPLWAGMASTHPARLLYHRIAAEVQEALPSNSVPLLLRSQVVGDALSAHTKNPSEIARSKSPKMAGLQH